jgi:uncharacterized protein (TIGR02598 family)
MDFFLIDLKISILEWYRSEFAAASKSKSHPMPDSPPDSDTARRKHPQAGKLAFSLVEVVIAMGIFSFAIVATFSLIGQSFKSYSSAINDTVSRQIMNQLAANAQQARLSDLTTTPSYTLNFDNEGNPVPSSDTMSVYTANVSFTQATTPFGSTNLYAVNIKVSPKNTNDAQQTTLIVCPQN